MSAHHTRLPPCAAWIILYFLTLISLLEEGSRMLHGSHRYHHLSQVDPEAYTLLQKQTRLEASTLKMIPSENFAQFAVLEATGSILTNKYCEGYPGARYYEGNEFVDEVENLAIERAKTLFGAEHANVQPYSGSPANQAAYRALVAPGSKIMGMPVPQGGHLTHGWRVNFSGTDYVQVPYGVSPKTGLLDFDQIRDLARRERPRMIWVGGNFLSPRLPIRHVRRDRSRSRRLPGGRHRPHQRSDRGRRPSRPGALLRRGDQHHPQDAPRSAGRLHPLSDRGSLSAEVPRTKQA